MGFQVFNIIDNLGEPEEKREPAPVLAIAHEITGGLLECRRMRAGFEKKMLALLNPEQREQFIDLKEQPVFGREARGARRGEAELHPLSPRVDRTLDLTEEQRKQLAEMRQQWQMQFRNLLTQEQRERWERMTRSGRQSSPRAEE